VACVSCNERHSTSSAPDHEADVRHTSQDRDVLGPKRDLGLRRQVGIGVPPSSSPCRGRGRLPAELRTTITLGREEAPVAPGDPVPEHRICKFRMYSVNSGIFPFALL